MKKYFLLAAASIALVGCNSEDNDIEQSVAVRVTATIGNDLVSRASDESWDRGDEIGVGMDMHYANMKYTTVDGDGAFSGTQMYFPDKRKPFTLTAYYPFTGTEGTAAGIISAITSSEYQTEDKQSGIDFLYAIKENVVAASDPTVRFNFSHRMGKVTLLIRKGDGMESISLSSFELDGLMLEGTFDTSTGLCSASEETAGAVTVSELSEGEDGTVKYSVIFFPQDTAGKTVTLKIEDKAGNCYYGNLSFKDDKIASGNNYQFSVTVNKAAMVVGQSTITAWNLVDMGAVDSK